MSAPAPPLQIALFAAASRLATRALQELLAAHWRVVAVAMFRPKPRGWRDLLRALPRPRRLSPIERYVRELCIPIIPVTETIQPPDAPFQDWMNGQLLQLQNALNPTLGQ